MGQPWAIRFSLHILGVALSPFIAFALKLFLPRVRIQSRTPLALARPAPDGRAS